MMRILAALLLLAQTARPAVKLGDSFAKASIVALSTIETDLSVPARANGKIVVAGATQQKVAEADAEAVTAQELQMSNQTRIVFLHHLSVNLERNRLRKFWGIELSPTSPDGRYIAGLEEGENLCREALIAGLRRRALVRPTACGAMLKDALSEK